MEARDKAKGVLVIALWLGFFLPVALRLFDFSQNEGSQQYSHFVLIPLIAGYVAFLERRRIRRTDPAGTGLALILLALSAALYCLGSFDVFRLSLNDHLALMTSSLLVYIVGAFIWIFGTGAFRVARFPLLFLVFLIPVPEFLLHRIVISLQAASADVVDFLFAATGSVYFRDGFFFSLPGLTIEVAEQCSGIRSGLSLFIVSILLGHLSLRTSWGKVALSLAVFPITVFKNGVRIVLLSLIAIHWDPAVMHGPLHTTGGVPFFIVAMLLLAIVFLGIRRVEQRIRRSRALAEPVDSAADAKEVGGELLR